MSLSPTTRISDSYPAGASASGSAVAAPAGVALVPGGRAAGFARGWQAFRLRLLPSLAKELRLQRSNLLFLCGVLFFWVLLIALSFARETQVVGYRMSDIASVVHTFAVQFCLFVLLPLMYGATSIASERQLGVLDWQLAVPRQRRRQLLEKAVVVLGLAAVTGGGITLLLERLLPGQHLFAKLINGVWPGTYSLLLAAIGMYVSTYTRDAARAMVLALPVVVVTAGMTYLADPAWVLIPPMDLLPAHEQWEDVRFGALAAVLLLLAAGNFRPAAPPIRRALQHVPLWALFVYAATIWTQYQVRGVDLKPSSSPREAAVVAHVQSLVATTPPEKPLAEEKWAHTRSTRQPPSSTIELLMGEPANWLSVISGGASGVFFSEHLYRTQNGKLLGLGGTQEKLDPSRSDWFELQKDAVWFELDVHTARTRQFPSVLGFYQASFKSGGYAFSSVYGRPLHTGVLPFITTLGKAEAEFPTDVELPPAGYQKETDTLLQVSDMNSRRSGHWETYYLPGVKMQDEKGKSFTPSVYRKEHEWPNNLVVFQSRIAGSDDPLTTRGQIHLALLRPETREAKLLASSPFTGNYYQRFNVDPTGKWFATPQPMTSVSFEGKFGDIQIVSTSPANNNSTSHTLPANNKLISFGNHTSNLYEATAEGKLKPGFSTLPVSPNGKYLPWMRVTRRSESVRGFLVPSWYEVLVLDLQTGESRLVGGFPSSSAETAHNLLKYALPRYSGDKSARLSAEHLSNIDTSPRFAWSPGGRLAVQTGDDLYLFDPAAKGGPKPEFVHMQLEWTAADNVVFWDENTLVLTGPKSIWRLKLDPAVWQK